VSSSNLLPVSKTVCVFRISLLIFTRLADSRSRNYPRLFRNTNCECPHYAIFPNLLCLPPFYLQIFSWISCSVIPAVFVSERSEWDHVSYPYKTNRYTAVLCISIFKFLDLLVSIINNSIALHFVQRPGNCLGYQIINTPRNQQGRCGFSIHWELNIRTVQPYSESN